MMRAARSTGYLVTLFALDILTMQIAIPIAMRLRLALPFGDTIQPEWIADELFYTPTLWLYLVVFAVWTLTLIFASVYTPRRVAFWGEEIQRLLLGHTAAALILAGILYLGKAELPRLTFVYLYALALLLMVLSRVVLRAWYWLRNKPALQTMRLLVAGEGDSALRIVEQLQRSAWPGLTLLGVAGSLERAAESSPVVVPVLGTLDDIPHIIGEHKVDGVLIALPRERHEMLAELVATLNELPVRLYIVPDYLDLAFFDATIERLGPLPLIGLRDPAIDGLQRILKRLMDILIALLALLILGPLMLAAALAIKLEDGGPVIYRTARMGENGRVFSMLKFRSMVVGADALQSAVNQTDAEGNVLHKREDDPRITRMGRIMRRTSFDELPQLVNVLRGEMSIVGPRPELPWLMENYALWQRKRFAVPQGMTGWWQIHSRGDSPLQYLHSDEDLYYVQNYSLWLDIQILWKTLAVVLRGKGAY